MVIHLIIIDTELTYLQNKLINNWNQKKLKYFYEMLLRSLFIAAHHNTLWKQKEDK